MKLLRLVQKPFKCGNWALRLLVERRDPDEWLSQFLQKSSAYDNNDGMSAVKRR